MYYWTPKRIKELKEKGYKLRLVKHDPGDEQASEQAIQETVPHNDIEEANEQGSEQASEELKSLQAYVKKTKKPI